jgi:hypothetical protein
MPPGSLKTAWHKPKSLANRDFILPTPPDDTFFEYLTFCFETHTKISLLLESLIANVPAEDLIENPQLRDVDLALLAVFFSQCPWSERGKLSGFILEKGSRLLRHVELAAIAPDVVVGGFENPAVNLNYLSTR